MLLPSDTNGSLNGRRERGKSQTRPPGPSGGRKKEAGEEGSKQKNNGPTGAARDVADAETIIAGAKRYAIERANEPPKYTKHPARWLRAGSWTDEPAASANGPP